MPSKAPHKPLIYALACAAALTPLASHGDEMKGERPVQITLAGKPRNLYAESHALVIGVSDYTAGWDDLPNVSGEMTQLTTALKEQGFSVTSPADLSSDGIKAAVDDFISRYGFEKENRLLIFFSGHGHSRENNTKGYLVPADAPHPARDNGGFLAKAIDMNQVVAWAKRIEAKHALFLFDSCFAGTVFATRDAPATPPQIDEATTLPVRQFITAGGAGDQVPARSVFTPAFIDALRYRRGDLDRDGYVIGTELGIYLKGEVPNYTRQIPQYGKISDYHLGRGDFVFQVDQPTANTPQPNDDKGRTKGAALKHKL